MGQCVLASHGHVCGRPLQTPHAAQGHDLAFHSELRDALFASGLPFLLSINDVPEVCNLYSRAGSITRLCSGKNGSKPELLVVHRGNPAVATGLSKAILG